MVEVTDIAIAKLIEKKVDSVRLGVTGGGCSGYEYVFVEDEFKDGDVELDYGQFKFLIDTMSQYFLIKNYLRKIKKRQYWNSTKKIKLFSKKK